MKPQPANFIPIITSHAGSTLTLKNWEQAGLRMISVHLESLLMKPGLALLQSLSNIRDYYAWPYEIVLNANLTKDESKDSYTIRSVYDGSLIFIDTPTLLDLIIKLKADKVVLPVGLAEEDLPELKTLPDGFFESDLIMKEGMEGIAYTKEGKIHLLSASMQKAHIPIDKGCLCETCSQAFTRAYLHHLLQATPLLAERFIIQHNVWSFIKSFT